MRLATLFLLSIVALAAPVAAQRRRPVVPPPVALSFAPDTSPGAPPHRWVVALRATSDVEVQADRRLLWLEVRAEGSRRALRCESPARPRRIDHARTRTLSSGETWAEWLDVRSVCWGAARRALDAGASVTAHFGATRWRMDVARSDAGAWRELVQPGTETAPVVTPPEHPQPVFAVSLADADVLTGRRLALRVTVRAGSVPVYAWVRPDRFSFRVVAPDGSPYSCRISRGGGAPMRDLFTRLGTTRGTTRSLDARQFCGPDVFALEGIYEVTPILELDASGMEWHLATPLGVFEGPPATVRVRAGEHGYVEHPIGGSS